MARFKFRIQFRLRHQAAESSQAFFPPTGEKQLGCRPEHGTLTGFRKALALWGRGWKTHRRDQGGCVPSWPGYELDLAETAPGYGESW